MPSIKDFMIALLAILFMLMLSVGGAIVVVAIIKLGMG